MSTIGWKLYTFLCCVLARSLGLTDRIDTFLFRELRVMGDIFESMSLCIVCKQASLRERMKLLFCSN